METRGWQKSVSAGQELAAQAVSMEISFQGGVGQGWKLFLGILMVKRVREKGYGGAWVMVKASLEGSEQEAVGKRQGTGKNGTLSLGGQENRKGKEKKK